MKIEMQLRSAQTVTPQMINSMKILQYGAQELSEYLSELSYENPLLELQEPQPDETADGFADHLRWLQGNDRQNRNYYADDQRDHSLSAPAAENRTLETYLHEQLLPLDLPADLRRTAEVLVALLDEHGFFSGSISEVTRLAQCSEHTAQKALELLQQLEPAGVGCKNVQESLLCQLERLEQDTELPRRILTEQSNHMQSPTRLAAAFKVSPAEVDAALTLIATLTPYPADGFAAQEATVYIRPDLYILQEGSHFIARCSEDALPDVHINNQYLKMLDCEQEPAVQTYLKEKLRQVEQVIHDLNNRKSTMLRCGEILADRQRAFFEGGSLKKLTLRDIAQELEVHESTVCRTVRDKYIQCDRGLFPMGYFFNRSAGQNPTLCRRNIQEVLAELIAEEDPAHPYSDEKLSALLFAQHIVISRRTVAKYRSELGILPAGARKRPKM